MHISVKMKLFQFSVGEKTNILLGVFVGSLIAANLIGLKIASFGIFEASVGILLFPILFLVTDIIEEVHGKKKTQEFVIIAFITLMIVLAILVIAVLLPTASRSFVDHETYSSIFGTTIRIFIASITAFLIAQFHDIWAFNFWKQKTKGKHLWLRNNLSTIVSTFIDTTLFMFIAFFGITMTSMFDPANSKFNVEYLFQLIIPYWFIKILFAMFDTPFCYLGVRWLKGIKKKISYSYVIKEGIILSTAIIIADIILIYGMLFNRDIYLVATYPVFVCLWFVLVLIFILHIYCAITGKKSYIFLDVQRYKGSKKNT